jgi:hypothetical protein
MTDEEIENAAYQKRLAEIDAEEEYQKSLADIVEQTDI